MLTTEMTYRLVTNPDPKTIAALDDRTLDRLDEYCRVGAAKTEARVAQIGFLVPNGTHRRSRRVIRVAEFKRLRSVIIDEQNRRLLES